MTSINDTGSTQAPSTGTDNSQSSGNNKPDISHVERQTQHYIDVFKAVLSSCIAGAEKGVEEVIEFAVELADAAYHRLFKSQPVAPTGETGNVVPDGIHRDPGNPNLDPALPQKLPDDKPPEVPVTPPTDQGQKPSDKPADKPADKPSTDPVKDPAADKPVDPAPSTGTQTPAATPAGTPSPVADKPAGGTDAAHGK